MTELHMQCQDGESCPDKLERGANKLNTGQWVHKGNDASPENNHPLRVHVYAHSIQQKVLHLSGRAWPARHIDDSHCCRRGAIAWSQSLDEVAYCLQVNYAKDLLCLRDQGST